MDEGRDRVGRFHLIVAIPARARPRGRCDGERCTGRGACGSGRYRRPAIRIARPESSLSTAPGIVLAHDTRASPRRSSSAPPARLRRLFRRDAGEPRSARLPSRAAIRPRAQLPAVDEEAAARGRPRPRRRPWHAAREPACESSGHTAAEPLPRGLQPVGGRWADLVEPRRDTRSTSSRPGGESNSSSYTRSSSRCTREPSRARSRRAARPRPRPGVDDSPVHPLAATTSASATASGGRPHDGGAPGSAPYAQSSGS